MLDFMKNVPPKHILCVHKSIELYGADRMFLLSVVTFRKAYPAAKITVILPYRGDLSNLLKPYCDEIEYKRMAILRRAHFHRGAWRKFRPFVRALYRAFEKAYDVDLLYISTINIVCYTLVARFLRSIPTVIHMHELPLGLEAHIFSSYLKISGAHCLAISEAVALSLFRANDRRVSLVPNGIIPPPKSATPLPQTPGKIHILMIGRFSSWKGQPLLIKALSNLPKESQDKVEVFFIGNSFRGQENYLIEAKQLCRDLKLHCTYSFHDFSPTAGDFFAWSDIVVIPSTKPEPFGLVSIEGMAYSSAIIAADHGGLADIVVDKETGLKFEPQNDAALTKAIDHYIQNRNDIKKHGAAGRRRFEAEYTIEVYSKNFIAAVENNTMR